MHVYEPVVRMWNSWSTTHPVVTAQSCSPNEENRFLTLRWFITLSVRVSSPCTWSHPSDRGAGGVVAIADRAWFAAQWRSAVRGTVRTSPSTGHRRHTQGSLLLLLPDMCIVWALLLLLVPVYNKRTGQTSDLNGRKWQISLWWAEFIHLQLIIKTAHK